MIEGQRFIKQKTDMSTNTLYPSLADVLLREPASVYHGEAGHNLTSHLLGDFHKSPLLYHRKRCGLVPHQDGPAYLVGRAAHTMILEGLEEFKRGYAVGGPVNPKTGLPYGPNTKAAAEWAAAHNKEILTDEQYELVAAMGIGVKRHHKAFELLGSGVPEGVVRTRYAERPCQIRIDWYSPEHGIVDLKTCDTLDYFESDARRYRYAYQMAFYRAVLAQAIGEYVPVHFVAVEKHEPFRCGVWRISEEVLGLAQRVNEQDIERLRRCDAANEWPTGYEEPRIFDEF